MVKVFYSQKTKQLIKQIELTSEVRLLGFDLSVTIQNRNSNAAIEITKIIEKLSTIWRD